MKVSVRLVYIVFLTAFLSITNISALANAAKDEWTQVKSKNFILVGNASEKDIRKVGVKLEQFRETFRLLFNTAKLTASIPTNVVVFKNDSTYKPFKPKRADGKINTEIAGYFQPGEDVNYITLSVEGDDKTVFGTIFHEYVHFIINTNFGRSDVPQWFNEGLAEYYQTFEIVDDIKVKLGLPHSGHLSLLQRSQLMPLDALFNVSNFDLHQSGGHSRSLFYAQSWALVHYLTQTDRSDALDKFLNAVLKGILPKTAFESAFQTTYDKLEKELKTYVAKNSFTYREIKFNQRLAFDTSMQSSVLDEAASNAYLGDLLYHANRPDDAEPYLMNAVRLNPSSNLANTALGMLRIKQRKFDEARKYLETAISGDPSNHIALYRYAYLLSREGQDEFGFVSRFKPETAAKMRDSLKKAIAIDPGYTESYELLAFLALVNNEELDEATALLQTALKYQPGNQRYALRIAEIFSRQKKYDEAKRISEKIATNAEDNETRSRADSLLSQITQQIEIDKRNELERMRFEAAVAGAGGTPRLTKRIEGVKRPTDAEIAQQQAMEHLRSVNDALRIPLDGEQRLLGRIEKIDCKKRPILFTIRSADEVISLTSKDFESLILNALDPAANRFDVGCDARIGIFYVLVTYRPINVAKSSVRGELVGLEFVPDNFRFLTREEMQSGTLVIYDEEEPSALARTIDPPPLLAANEEEFLAKRRELLWQAIANAIRKPRESEKRDMGFLEKVECTNKSAYFYIRTVERTFKLLSQPSQPPAIVFFTPDLQGVQIGCNSKSIEFPAVFIYNLKPDNKTKTDGEIVSLEFVPKSYNLDR